MIRLLSRRRAVGASSRSRTSSSKPSVLSAAARSSAPCIEPLELRRLLSATLYNQTSQINEPGSAPGNAFGFAMATQGNLALISSPGKSVGSGIGQTGEVYLVDTTTGQVQHTFTDPNPIANEQFGIKAIFVGSDVAISSGDGVGHERIFVYSGASFSTSVEIDNPSTGQPNGGGSGFAADLTTDGTDIFTAQSLTDTAAGGEVLRYSTAGGAPIQTYQDSTGTHGHGLGVALAVSNDTVYVTAFIDSNADTQVLAFDKSNGNYLRNLAEPTPPPDSTTPSFGSLLSVSPEGDLYATDLGAVYQFDSSGNFVREYTAPPLGVFGVLNGSFGNSVAFNDQGQVIIGAPTTLVVDDPNNPTAADQVGAVYVFNRSDGSSVGTIENVPPVIDGSVTTSLGERVAALPNGQVLVADIDSNSTTGAVYVYAPEGTNQPPVANAGAPQTTTENSTVTLDASGSTDPDGQSDIVSYQWDLNYDGNPADFVADATGVTVPFTQDLPGTYTVAVQVTDSAGHTDIASTTVTFTDVLPTANAGANQTAVTQQAVNFNGSGANASGDLIVNYEWDFNYDGNPADFVANSTGANASNTYTAPGTYTAALRVTDDDGQQAIATALVTVTSTAVENGVLYVGAGNTGSSITLANNSTGGTNVTINGVTTAFAGQTIVLLGGAGNDNINAYSAPANVTLVMFGGAGNDSLYAGGANDILVGGDGNDVLTGGKGRDILIGGMGSDTINGDQDDDVLIAGYTDHDNSVSDLESILAIWNSSDTYTNRVTTLQNTLLRPNIDVFDDGAADVLKGSSGTDYFIFNVDQDTTDLKSFEDGTTTT